MKQGDNPFHEPLVACHECDAIYVRHAIEAGAKAVCLRCANELYRHIPHSLDKSLALYIATFVLFVIANFYPFLSLQTTGLFEQSQVYSAGLALYKFGMAELGLVVFLTSILFPLIAILGMLYLLVPLRFDYLPMFHGEVYRLVKLAQPWSLLSVFLLGSLIAVVKLQSLATVNPGIGLYAFVAMLFAYAAAQANFDPEVIWHKSQVKQLTVNQLAQGEKMLQCHCCGLIRPFSEDHKQCERCHGSIHFRKHESVQRTWALLLSAAVMLIPANLLPVMTVKTLGRGSPDTIMSGVIHLLEGGMWSLALIVLFASIVVPLLKLIALSFLLYSVSSESDWRPKDRTVLYRITELVGAWSMVDVFLVGLLCGLVSLGLIASIEPGLGASFFATAVIFTILAARSFDPRLIWDGALKPPPVTDMITDVNTPSTNNTNNNENNDIRVIQ